MKTNTASDLVFGGFRLNARERQFFDNEKPVTMAPKVFDTLLMLVENAGHVLSKERMLNEIWQGSFVEENNLAQNISFLRKVLGESIDNKFIETVPKFGYRFVAEVNQVSDAGLGVLAAVSASTGVKEKTDREKLLDSTQIRLAKAAPALGPETKYVRNGDVNIAYQVVGEGPVDIVFVMGWVSHLEYFWREPRVARFFKRLASFSRLILFDKRGTGLSDRVPLNELPTLEQRMEDVNAVMEAVGSRRAVLIGVSEGGPMCSLFAATYPERTLALVMFGTYAKRIREDDYPWAPTTEQREAFFDLMQREWGTAVGIEERAPSLANDDEFREWWSAYLRMGASPGAAVALTKMNAEIDVRNVLPSIRVPTLVIHRSGDMCLKVEEGRYVASKIPGCKFVELPGIDHLPFVGDQDSVLDAIDHFVTGTIYPGTYDRVLATVMNLRITDPKAEVRKRTEIDLRELLERAKAFVQRQLEIFRGREVEYHNGGVLATFDGPARAIRCAVSITEAAAGLGISVKAGLHTGECDVIDDKYAGLAVDLAQKITDEAEPGIILVSRTVKDLVAGSGISFIESGLKDFGGNLGEWRLFVVDH